MKKVFYWALAILITLTAVIYQRKTGPTYDKKVKILIEKEEYNFKLIRSHGGDEDCKIELLIADQSVSGILEYKKFPTRDAWTKVDMNRDADKLVALLPHLPPAVKY